MDERRGCLICGSDNAKVLFTCRDTLTTGGSFPVSKCTDCGFVYTLSPPAESEIGKYYLSDDYISHSDLKRGLTERLYHFARSFMLKRKLRLVRSVTNLKHGRILDIGCGTGYFPAFMKKNGWDATGIEISDNARNFATARFGLNVIPPDKSDDLQVKYFDCITLWHVMEHFHDPVAWFAKIDSLLKDGGVCLVALPNADSSDASWFRQDWAAYDVPRHLWHFSPSSFSRFVAKNGFHVEKTVNMPLDIFYISILSFKSSKRSFPLVRGLLVASMLSAGNIFKKEKSSSVIYILKRAQG